MVVSSLKLSLILFVLFAIPLLLIRARAYEGQDMQALFAPEDCPLPCFMGIRPGVTTVEDALTILEASGRVENVQVDWELGFVNWDWKGVPPAGVNGAGLSYISFVQDTVSIISLSVLFQYGDFFMRTPEFLNTWPMTMGITPRPGDTTLTLWFEKPEFTLRFTISCRRLWQSSVVVLFNSNPLDFPMVFSNDDGLSVVNYIFHMCGQDGSAALLSEQP